ncbi:hypothetical protein B0O99DRAFT_598989 [Bisporella sp. PMI_857]|nr:hypothetical protein B0O99DRAFT_598989 [Bisporella sp. PMI_857]
MASLDIPSASPTIATKTTTTAKTVSPEEFTEFTAYINDSQLNWTFQLPADRLRGCPKPFQVSYADFGFHCEDAATTIVRIVNAERQGIGKTDSVPAERLLKVWQEVIPALLNHLGTKHVSIGCNGGGAVISLDFAVHNPQFLHPS